MCVWFPTKCAHTQYEKKIWISQHDLKKRFILFPSSFENLKTKFIEDQQFNETLLRPNYPITRSYKEKVVEVPQNITRSQIKKKN